MSLLYHESYLDLCDNGRKPTNKHTYVLTWSILKFFVTTDHSLTFLDILFYRNTNTKF